MNQLHQQDTGLVWCHGCQTNVKPQIGSLGYECPQCSASIRSYPTVKDIDVPPSENYDTDTRAGPPLFDDDELVQTPMGGRLVLNPKVKKPGKNPLCPDCEQEIRRDETSNGLVEFVCGCEDLRHFEFKERGER